MLPLQKQVFDIITTCVAGSGDAGSGAWAGGGLRAAKTG
jgi:hypothetical protein